MHGTLPFEMCSPFEMINDEHPRTEVDLTASMHPSVGVLRPQEDVDALDIWSCVLLSTKKVALSTPDLTKPLPLFLGSFEVVGKIVGVANRLKLPHHMSMHPSLCESIEGVTSSSCSGWKWIDI